MVGWYCFSTCCPGFESRYSQGPRILGEYCLVSAGAKERSFTSCLEYGQSQSYKNDTTSIRQASFRQVSIGQASVGQVYKGGVNWSSSKIMRQFVK